MSFIPEHLREKPPVLSRKDIELCHGEFVADIDRQLIILGAKNPDTIAALIARRDAIEVTSFIAGPKARYHSEDGGRLTAAEAAQEIAEQVAERAALLKHGPDPVGVLNQRLQQLGVPKGEADFYAPQFIRRLPDGRVVRLDPVTREPVTLIGEKPSTVTFTEEQWAAYRDGTRELARATREVLARIEEDKKRRPHGPSVNPVLGAF